MAEFTFSTGLVVKIKRVSPFLLTEIRRAMPAPAPPVQEVEIGGEKRTEPNPADPDYAAALVAHEQKVRERETRFVVERGVVPPEDFRGQVAALREEWQKEFGTDLSEPDDLHAWVQYIACSGYDYQLLVNAVLGASQPSEQGVTAEAESFRGQVPGA